MSTLHSFIRRPRQQGSTLVTVTLFIVVLFAFAALSLDVGNVLREQRKAQLSTDAAALAAVMVLTNAVHDSTLIALAQTTALDVAAANGVTAAEIAASTAGAVQLGIVLNNQFYANQTINSRYSAVRVPAKRTVPLPFARVVGLDTMTPAVASVASLEALSAVSGLRPFTISSNLLANVTPGQPIVVNEAQVGVENSGQWGQLDYQNTLLGNAWYEAMVGGYQGLIPTGNNWAELNQGNDHVRQAFNYLINNQVRIVIPVVDTFVGVPNNGNVNIVGFVGLDVTGYSQQGRNSVITFILRDTIATGVGGGTPGPYVPTGRFLVR